MSLFERLGSGAFLEKSAIDQYWVEGQRATAIKEIQIPGTTPSLT